MNLPANPIFLTQRTLVHRNGVLAPLLIAWLLGLCPLVAYFYQRALGEESPASLGRVSYGFVLAIQALVVVLGGFSRISRTLVEERKAGLFDSNRLTPLEPSELVLGYWLGAGLREVYMALALAPIGAVIIGLSGLPWMLWVGTQALLLTTALLFGLLEVLAGMALSKDHGGPGMFLLLIFLGPLNLAFSEHSVANFLLPIHSLQWLFDGSHVKGPYLYGWTVPSLALTWTVQLILGVLCWRGAVRKMADPTRPAFTLKMTLLIFGILVFTQHGLIWHQDVADAFPVVHGATLLLGLVLVATLSLNPDQARMTAVRLGNGDLAWVLRHSSAGIALALAATASAALAMHFVGDGGGDWRPWLSGTAILITALLAMAFLREMCRLMFRRRTGGFVALGAFVLFILPLILAAVFDSGKMAAYSFFTPGIIALTPRKSLPFPVAPLIVHE